MVQQLPAYSMSSGKLHAPSSSAGLGISLSPCATLSSKLESDAATCNSTMHFNLTEVNATSRLHESPSSLSTDDLFRVSRALVEKPSISSNFVNPLRGSVVTSDRDMSEINTFLGDSKSRLKSGIKLLSKNSGEERGLGLEKARRQSRVDIDIFLKSDISIEDGHLQGIIKIHIRKHKKKGQRILVSGGKVMAIGFESGPNQEERFIFYQSSAMLSEVASDLDTLYSLEPDPEGFFGSRQGDHWLPFSLCLSSSSAYGKPKGSIHTQSGLSVRYIVMVFLRIKDSASGKKSIAHMYRECSIWPRLNPSAILATPSRPIQVTVSENSSSGRIKLTASLHRLHWVAGQLCHISLEVVNDSKKALKNVTLGLIQSVTTFKLSEVQHESDSVRKDGHPSVTHKLVAQSYLVAGESSKKGHASAKGWWLGVPAGTSQMFSHSILLPSDSLSVRSGQLLAISYTIEITVGTGTLFSTDVNASLPLEIINFMSIDPPPDAANQSEIRRSICSTIVDEYNTDLESEDAASSDEDHISAATDDEIIQRTVLSARIDTEYAENTPRFADLYHSSERTPDRNAEQSLEQAPEDMDVTFPSMSDNKTSGMGLVLTDGKPHVSDFADRVEKMNQIRQASLLECAGDSMESNSSFVSARHSSSSRSSGESASKSSEPTPSGNNVPEIKFQDQALLSSAKNSNILSAAPRENSGVSLGDIIDAYAQPPDLPTSQLLNPRRILQTSGLCKDSEVLATRFNLSTTDPRPGTVRDKIRELEELAAKVK